MSIKDIFRDYTLFIDGNLFSGDVSSVMLPKLNWKVEEYRGGAMDIPVEVKLGHEKIELEFDLTAHSALLTGFYGLAQGNQKIFKFFGVLVDYQGNETGVQLETHGFIRTIDRGQVQPGAKTTEKYTVCCDYMKHTIDNQVVLEIDALNKKFIVNGVDQVANQRQLLGIGL
jgi:P2 family phage contractile tail tube protein